VARRPHPYSPDAAARERLSDKIHATHERVQIWPNYHKPGSEPDERTFDAESAHKPIANDQM
jgi:hypothetical protein